MADGPSSRGNDPRRRASGTGSRSGSRRASASGGSAGSRPSAGPRRGGPRVPVADRAATSVRPRFTGRAAVLVLVLALLLVSYASSMRAYLAQRQHLASLRQSIATSQAQVDLLTKEKARWNDPAYVRTVAHQRFGWVLPGEVGFQVLDASGKPLDPVNTLSSPSSVPSPSRPLWWQSTWGSVVAAGKPQVAPQDQPRPVTRITPPKLPKATGTGH